MKSEVKKFLTVRDVARMLSVHPNTVRSWDRKGLIRSYKLGSRRDRRYSIQDVEAFLDSQGD